MSANAEQTNRNVFIRQPPAFGGAKPILQIRSIRWLGTHRGRRSRCHLHNSSLPLPRRKAPVRLSCTHRSGTISHPQYSVLCMGRPLRGNTPSCIGPSLAMNNIRLRCCMFLHCRSRRWHRSYRCHRSYRSCRSRRNLVKRTRQWTGILSLRVSSTQVARQTRNIHHRSAHSALSRTGSSPKDNSPTPGSSINRT